MATERASTTAGGRPRDPRIGDAVLTATLELLETSTYDALAIEEVARRAETSRPAIYRRWPGRAHLVLAAIATRLAVPEPPDTGCTLCDLDEGFGVFLAAYRTIRPEILTALYAECAADAELRSRYAAMVVDPARAAVGRTLERAVARGDLREATDRDLLLDLVGALVHHRAAFGEHHLTGAEAAGAIEMLLRGAAVDYDALLAHSEKVEHIGHPPSHPGAPQR